MHANRLNLRFNSLVRLRSARSAWLLISLVGWIACVIAACAAPTMSAPDHENIGGEANTAEMSGDEIARMSADELMEMMKGDPDQAHLEVFLKSPYPSAHLCGQCHPKHFEEWSVSSHAYAQLSPIFNAMQAKTNQITNGTNADFCIRCHTPVGMQMGESTFMSTMDRAQVSREGVTCIVCHRIDENYGKVSGRIHVKQGSLFDPIYGPTGNAEVARVIEDGEIRLAVNEGETGQPIHAKAEKFFHLSTSAFCGQCHDVTLPNGFRLEEAFSEYKTSPAAARGETCQDCHMGLEPGKASGYAHGPAAQIGNFATKPRKITSHMFSGPDFSVIHPGLFPHNTAALELASMREWLEFDVEAGWGLESFERSVDAGAKFPQAWSDPAKRRSARMVLTENLSLLERAKQERIKLLRTGYVLGDVKGAPALMGDLAFNVEIKSGTDGHNVPTGFTAERMVWVYVRVTDADGREVLVSGDLDPNGDLRNHESAYVHHGELEADEHLLSLRSQFLTRSRHGSEREQILPLNYSQDPLPFIRPSTFPAILSGRPLGARIQKKGIEPGGSRSMTYTIPAEKLTGKAPYSIEVQLKAGMVPVHLVRRIADVGFDFNMSAREVGDALVEGQVVLWSREFTLTP